MSRVRRHQHHNLPADRTRLIGREHEVEAIRQALLGSDGLLVTLTGAGGCGKTRLALRVAADVADGFVDGGWLVELAPLADPALVPEAVATALGVREQPAKPMLDTLVTSLKSRRLLLVLDNCEHLVDGCAHLADVGLGRCASIRLLVTSRQPLGIEGEMIWRVPPLALTDVLSPSLDELVRSPAVQLFVERALAVQPAFELTGQNAPIIGKICRRLDGLPLGIEVAAARLRALGLEQILERLDASIGMLMGSSRTAPDRQRTMQATLDWSHSLLTALEQAVFRRLAVFAGGWSLEAAEAVCAGDLVDEASVLELLSRLVDKSLVVMDERDRRARYRLLEPVRQYADKRLRMSGDLEDARARHAAHFLVVAERLAGWARREQQIAVAVLEQDNLRAALRWCLEHAAPDVGLRLARGCIFFWHARGASQEGLMWMRQLLALPGAEQPTVARAAALSSSGWHAVLRGDFAAARTLHERGLATAREVGDPHQLFSNLNDAGIGALYRGDYALAEEYFGEALATARAAGDPVTEAVGLIDLGWLASARTDYAVARLRGEQCLRLARTIGELWLIGVGLNISGYAALGQGEVATARRLFDEALPILRQVGDQWLTAHTLDGLARVALVQQGHAEAQVLFAESLTFRHNAGDSVLIAHSLEGMAALAAASGLPDRALHLAGAAAGLRQMINAPPHPEDRAWRDRWLDPLRRVLGAEAVARAWAMGEALTLDEAMALALEHPETTSRASTDFSSREPPRAPALSAREHEVASLLAEGLSNRQISQRLVITERTVAAHVEHILDKLGLNSRTQIALWAAEHRSPPRDQG